LTYDSQGNPEPGGSLFSLHSLGNNLMVSGFALTVAQWNAMAGPSFAVQFLAGNDVFRGGAGGDHFSAFGGRDTLLGNGGNDVLNGGAGNDTLNGGADNDTLNGGSGDDLITGGAGMDKMTGGAGHDTFIFASPAQTAARFADTITDFVHGTDKITLTAIDADTHKIGNQAFHFLAAKGAAFTHTAGDLRWSYGTSTTTIEGDVNGDARADFAIVLTGHKALAATDFHL
jgi:Ca2+-binding RTX toxin-like protein